MSLGFFKDNALADQVWKSKYRYQDETPDGTLRRIANAIGENEHKYIYDKDKFDKLSDYGKEIFEQLHNTDLATHQELFYNLIEDFEKFIPGGSILATLGTPKLASLSNCYVVPSPEDNIASIMDSIKTTAHIYASRGGAGTCIDKLRPRGARVNNAALTSSGSVSFMELYSANASVIGSEGRRSAQMLAMTDRHPDIEEFITVKTDLSKISGANLSVMMSKELVDSANSDKDWILTFPVDDKSLLEIDVDGAPYNELIYIDNNRYVKKVKAKELFDLIVKTAHQTAEPGILLIDNLINYDPASVYDNLRMTATNPLTLAA